MSVPTPRPTREQVDAEGGPWTRHGHDIPGVTVAGSGRPSVARCGGPSLCKKCALDAERERRDIAMVAAADRYDRAQEVVERAVPGPVGAALRELFDGLRTEHFTDEDGNRDYLVPVVGRASALIVSVVDALLSCDAAPLPAVPDGEDATCDSCGHDADHSGGECMWFDDVLTDYGHEQVPCHCDGSPNLDTDPNDPLGEDVPARLDDADERQEAALTALGDLCDEADAVARRAQHWPGIWRGFPSAVLTTREIRTAVAAALARPTGDDR